MALLRFGNYLSQYDVRAIATHGGNQSVDYYLVGENDAAAATALRLEKPSARLSFDGTPLYLYQVFQWG